MRDHIAAVTFGDSLTSQAYAEELMRIAGKESPQFRIQIERRSYPGAVTCELESISHTFEHLAAMHRYAIENKCVPVAVTIPQINSSYEPKIAAAASRKLINDPLKAYCAKNNIILADLCEGTADRETGFLNKALTYDGLHINSPEGSAVMAGIIYEQGLAPALQRIRQK